MAQLLRARRIIPVLVLPIRRALIALFAAPTIAIALEMAGLGMLAYGAYLIWTPAALFVLGGGMILFAQGVSR